MQKKILIVDDDKGVRAAIRLVCEGMGHEVAEAVNGEDALRSISAGLPDVIILDHDMPVMNGLEFYDRFRSDYGQKNIPVVFCSGRQDLYEKIQNKKNEKIYFLVKPYSISILKEIIMHV